MLRSKVKPFDEEVDANEAPDRDGPSGSCVGKGRRLSHDGRLAAPGNTTEDEGVRIVIFDMVEDGREARIVIPLVPAFDQSPVLSIANPAQYPVELRSPNTPRKDSLTVAIANQDDQVRLVAGALAPLNFYKQISIIFWPRTRSSQHPN